MKQVIIYIPGLGDHYDMMRRRALGLWSVFSVQTRLVPMRWYVHESYEDKYQRASAVIKEFAAQNVRVSLVGESAGGSMAINLFAHHPDVANVVLIAGVNQAAAPVSFHTLRKSPAFGVSKQAIDASLKMLSVPRLQRIHTVSGLMDSVVNPRYSHISGAHNHRILSAGHLVTIALCLTLYSWYIVLLARK